MPSDHHDNRYFIPYCLSVGGAGIILLAYMTFIWPAGLPLFSPKFCLLVVLATIFGSLGFYLGKKASLHVSLSSVFEVALLLSFGPLVTLWVSALSFSGAYLFRMLDRY